jgi:hypothetical protein
MIKNQSYSFQKVIELYSWIFFIIIHLEPQILTLKLDEDKMRWTNILHGHKYLMGGVVRDQGRVKAEVVGSIPAVVRCSFFTDRWVSSDLKKMLFFSLNLRFMKNNL